MTKININMIMRRGKIKTYAVIESGLFIMFVLFLSSCKSENKTNDLIYGIDPKSAGKGSIKLSSLLEKSEIILLETKPECLISSVRKVIKQDGKYYVQSGYNDLFAFNKDGKFLFRIGSNGTGPGEYNEFQDFDVNHKDQSVYVLDFNKILVYNGETAAFKKSMPLKVKSNRLKIINNDLILIQTTPEANCLTLINESGKKIKDFLPSDEINAVLNPIAFLYDKEDNIIFQQGPTADIVRFDVNTSSFECGVLSKNPIALTSEKFKPILQKYGFEAFGMMDDFMVISAAKFFENITLTIYSYKKNSYLLVNDNKTNKSRNFCLSNKSDINDDVAYCGPLFLRTMLASQSDDNCIIAFVNAYDIIKKINMLPDKESIKMSGLLNLVGSLNENSNPVLINLYFKNRAFTSQENKESTLFRH